MADCWYLGKNDRSIVFHNNVSEYSQKVNTYSCDNSCDNAKE